MALIIDDKKVDSETTQSNTYTPDVQELYVYASVETIETMVEETIVDNNKVTTALDYFKSIMATLIQSTEPDMDPFSKEEAGKLFLDTLTEALSKHPEIVEDYFGGSDNQIRVMKIVDNGGPFREALLAHWLADPNLPIMPETVDTVKGILEAQAKAQEIKEKNEKEATEEEPPKKKKKEKKKADKKDDEVTVSIKALAIGAAVVTVVVAGAFLLSRILNNDTDVIIIDNDDYL